MGELGAEEINAFEKTVGRGLLRFQRSAKALSPRDQEISNRLNLQPEEDLDVVKKALKDVTHPAINRRRFKGRAVHSKTHGQRIGGTSCRRK